MNHPRFLPFVLPSVFGNNQKQKVQPPNVSEINPDPVSITQSQTNSSSSSQPTHTSRNTSIHNERPNLQTLQPTNNKEITPPPGFIILHHDDTTNAVLDAYCSPVNETFTESVEQCKFKRDCIVLRTKLFMEGQHQSHISPSVYGSTNYTLKKIKYHTMDTRLVKCVNKLCKNTNTKVPKCFHYVCFMHKIHTKANDGMDIIVNTGVDDKIFDQLHTDVDVKTILGNIKDSEKQLIFPVCGKRCYNTILSMRNKKPVKTHSEYATTQSWDNDGNESKGIKSSIEVLIEWISTEENSSSYFGGFDPEGKTNATRKEGYHHYIRDIIKAENGKLACLRNKYLILCNCILMFVHNMK